MNGTRSRRVTLGSSFTFGSAVVGGARSRRIWAARRPYPLASSMIAITKPSFGAASVSGGIRSVNMQVSGRSGRAKT